MHCLIGVFLTDCSILVFELIIRNGVFPRYCSILVFELTMRKLVHTMVERISPKQRLRLTAPGYLDRCWVKRVINL